MDFDTKRLDPWERIIPTFKYNRDVPFFEMLVPTTDTVRYGYLMEKLLAVKHSVLFTGITGVGKVGNSHQTRSPLQMWGHGGLKIVSTRSNIISERNYFLAFSAFAGRMLCWIYIDPRNCSKVCRFLNTFLELILYELESPVGQHLCLGAFMFYSLVFCGLPLHWLDGNWPEEFAFPKDCW